MQIVRDDVWLCGDCRSIAVNGDYSGLDYHFGNDEDARDKRAAEIDAGLERLGPHLVNAEDGDDGRIEHSTHACDCCREPRAHGERFRFAILGES